MFKRKISLNSIFSRVLLFNILLVIIATIIPQFVFLNFFKSSYKYEIEQNNMQSVRLIQKTIDEQVLNKVVTLPVTYLSEIRSNDDLTFALYNDVSNNSQKIYKIMSRLRDIKNTYSFLDSVDLYYSMGNIIFINNGVQFLDDISSHKMHDVEWVDRIINTDLNLYWIPTRLDKQYKPNNVISLVQRIPFNASKETTKAIITVNIKEKAVNDYITNIKTNNMGILFIIDENGNIISSNDKGMKYMAAKTDGIIKDILSSKLYGIIQAKIDGKLNVISFVKSEINNWRYVSVSSIDDFYQKSYQLENYLIIITCILLFVNLLVCALFIKKAHEPVNNLIKAVKAITLKFSSSDNSGIKNEYKYLNNMVKNIESKMDDMNDKLRKNKPIIWHSILIKLLKGESSIHDNDSLLDLDFSQENYVCFVIKLYQERQLSFDDRMLISYSLIDILEGEYNEFHIYTIIDDNNNVAGIINFSSRIDMVYVETSISMNIESLLNSKYVLCFGNSYSIKNEDICKSYKEACECMKYAYIITRKKIIYYNELKIDTLKETGSSLKIMEKIESCVRTADEENLNYAVNSIIESLISGRYRIEFCKNTLMDMVSLIRMTIDNEGYNPDDMFECDIRDSFKSINDIEEFRLWIDKIISIFITRVYEKKLTENNQYDIDIRIKKYIEDNIYNELSLESAAHDLHMSVGYLSRLFKAKNGTTFTNYVTDLKMQFAKELLLHGNMAVKDVAVKLGYSSVQHFIKIFKEKYCCTPKKYQKQSFEDNT